MNINIVPALVVFLAACSQQTDNRERDQFIRSFVGSVYSGTDHYTNYLPAKDPEYFRKKMNAAREHMSADFEIDACDSSGDFQECSLTFSNGSTAIVYLSESFLGQITEASIVVYPARGMPRKP